MLLAEDPRSINAFLAFSIILGSRFANSRLPLCVLGLLKRNDILLKSVKLLLNKKLHDTIRHFNMKTVDNFSLNVIPKETCGTQKSSANMIATVIECFNK